MPAGYSGTPLPAKLGIRENARVVTVRAPREFRALLADLPPGVKLTARVPAGRAIDVAILFVRRESELVARFARLAAGLKPAGGLWVAWPKKASGVPTDLTEREVREVGLAGGLVDNKVCAIDATWSGLRFVRRLRDRAGL